VETDKNRQICRFLAERQIRIGGYDMGYFLLNYVTRFPENQSESESRIVRLIGKICLGSRAWFKTPTN
jgi:hypothetical protein